MDYYLWEGMLHGVIILSRVFQYTINTYKNSLLKSFLPPPRRDSNVKSDKTHIIIQHTTLSQYTSHLCHDFLQLCSFYSLSQLHQVMASHPSPGDNHQSMGGWSERTQGREKMAEWNLISYICTSTIHSFIFFTQPPQSSSVAQGHLHITPTIQANLDLPHTHPAFTSAIDTLLAIWYSIILSTCPNHLNTL